MVNHDDTRLKRYLQTHLMPFSDPGIMGIKHSDHILGLQSQAPRMHGNLSCGSLSLHSCPEYKVNLRFTGAPIDAHFKLELLLAPAPANPTEEQQAKSNRERIWVIFPTYVPGQKGQSDRTPYEYTNSRGNKPWIVKTDFSSQLNNVVYHRGDDFDVPKELCNKDTPAADHMFFSWQAKDCVRFKFSHNTDNISSKAAAAAKTFKEMIDKMIGGDGHDGRTMRFAAKRQPLVEEVFWPFFCALPNPIPESYFPWLQELDSANPLDIMQVRPNGDCELWSGYIDRTLGIRSGKDWHKKEDTKEFDATLLSPPVIASLDGITYFTNERMYLAHVLGSFCYEEFNSKKALWRYFNGDHKVEIIPNSQLGSRNYLILLNIRPPNPKQSADKDEQFGLPEVDEMVEVITTLHGSTQKLRGKVVRIPLEHSKKGRNVAVVAEESPLSPAAGRIVESGVYQATVHFGHYGTSSTHTRERIIGLMTGTLRKHDKKQPVVSKAIEFFKKLLLAQDLQSLPGNKYKFDALPKDFEKQVDEVCKKKHLNQEQTSVVRQYFTHRVTLARGPPGTGKTTLIDVIAKLEERFGQKIWVCADSNAAVDVVARKLCERKEDMQAVHFFRVRPTYQESLPSKTVNGVPQMVPLISYPPNPAGESRSVEAQIQEYLQDQSHVDQILSLSHSIGRRCSLIESIKNGKTSPMWPKEVMDLENLIGAFQNFNQLKYEQQSQQDWEKLEHSLQEKYYRALQRVQREYVRTAHGVFSTTAACDGPLLARLSPAGLIMDESSQAMEARAVSAIIHAVQGGSLARILLIGDDLQLPPTLTAERNPFSSTGKVSMFERLINAGFPVTTLRTQYRMHSTISTIINQEIYVKVGGIKDDPSTDEGARGVTKFQTFIKAFAKNYCAKNAFPDTNAVVVSPIEDPTMSWKAARQNGSTSRYNLVTARMVYHIAHLIKEQGNFAASDIMIISFYRDQVQLIQSLFEGLDGFSGINIKTVDSSQGSEAQVVIVDAVVLGDANGDGMGFLNQDKRRFNVAMSRAKVGRIVIAHEKMVKQLKGGAKLDAGPWNGFLDSAKKAGTIVSSTRLNGELPNQKMQDRLKDVFGTWKSNASADKKKDKFVGHSGFILDHVPRDAWEEWKDHTYESTTFIQLTGSTAAHAKSYLEGKKWILHEALDKWWQDYGLEGDIEEVEGTSLVVRQR